MMKFFKLILVACLLVSGTVQAASKQEIDSDVQYALQAFMT